MVRGLGRLSRTSIETLWTAGALGSLADGELLDHFASDPDVTGQEAFRILVERHGPMVLGVCRHLVGDRQDAEDAFQATFLVLIRRAGSIRQRETIAPWLHGVAVRVARKARLRSARRRAREVGLIDDPPARPDCDTSADHEALQEEIRRLPDSLRAPLVLCCLEGQSYDLAARRLGLSESTLRGRLHRARKRLEMRLRRRGVVASAVALWLEPSGVVLSPPMIENTTALAVRLARVGDLLAGAGSVPASVVTLAHGVISSMLIQTVKSCGIAAIASLGLVGTLVVAQSQQRTQKPEAGDAQPPAAQKPATAAKTYQYHPLTDERRQQLILRKLASTVPLDVAENPTLDEFLKAIKSATTDDGFPGIPIYMDPVGMQEAGAKVDSSVVVFKTGDLDFVLSQALRDLKLSYIVEHGYLQISSRTEITERRLRAIEAKLDRLLEWMNRLEHPSLDRKGVSQ